MKKVLLTITVVILLSGYGFAQAGNNAIAVGVSADFLLGPSYSAAYNIGFGGNVKGLYGIGDAGQATFTVAYSSFGGKSGTVFYSNQTLSLLPFLAGYRYNLPCDFYGEGQVGLGILTEHSPSFSAYAQTDPAAAVTVGYHKMGWDIGARFYTEGDVMNQFSIRLAYGFPVKIKK